MKRMTQEHLKNESGEGNVAGGLQVELEDDGGGSSRQSWMESSGLWPMIHWKWQCRSQVKSVKPSQKIAAIWSTTPEINLVCFILQNNNINANLLWTFLSCNVGFCIRTTSSIDLQHNQLIIHTTCRRVILSRKHTSKTVYISMYTSPLLPRRQLLCQPWRRHTDEGSFRSEDAKCFRCFLTPGSTDELQFLATSSPCRRTQIPRHLAPPACAVTTANC